MDEQERLLIRKWIHDLNNRVGTILATAELMQLDPQISPKTKDRSHLIENKALEARDILRQLGEKFF